MITMIEAMVFLNKVTMKFAVERRKRRRSPPLTTWRNGTALWLPYPRLNAGNLGLYSRKQTSSGLIGRNKTIHDLFGRKGQALLKLATSQSRRGTT